MARSIVIALLTVMVFAGSAASQGAFGLGVIVGEPTGVSAKIWMSDRSAVDMGAAWSFSDEAALHLHADFLLHNFDLISVENGRLPIHFGIGGRVKFEDDSKIGIRIPVGLTYIFDGAPVDIFVEAVPIVDLAPDTEFDVNAAIGARFYFGSTQ